MNEIHIYVEGGGDTAQQKSDLRQGFDCLLSRAKDKAREKRFRWSLIPCGGRQQAYEAFKNALKAKPLAINILLVDSEDPVSIFADQGIDAMIRVEHLKQRDNWAFDGVKPVHVHLMVQCMEAWIIADVDALKKFYGQGLLDNCLPKRDNLEEEPKINIYNKLRQATSHTQQGEYGKIKHASKLLKSIDVVKVEKRCPRFKEFMRWLEETIDPKPVPADEDI